MREKIKINQDWLFSKEENFDKKQKIDLPHTWNNEDGQDGGNDYYRGKCFYQKTFTCPELHEEELWLELEGVAYLCEVFLNGTLLGTHENGFSTFRFRLDEYLKDNNVLVVTADNSKSESYYPQVADFTFYGGIYRDVHLIKVPKKHFALDHYGSDGIKVTPELSADLKHCSVKVETWSNGDQVEIAIGEQIKRVDVTYGYAAVTFEIDDPHLWNGLKDPYLYKVKARLNSGDEVETNIGIRKYRIDPDKGFILNNEEYRLVGVSKHQDRQYKGNAVSKEDLEEDMALIRELGVTSLRLAHYQHSQYFYDLCDRYGLIVWAEIPYITRHINEGDENTRLLMKELIIQNYNHPSIVVWGLSNEITTHGGVNDDLLKNHQELNDLAHQLDPTRLTTMAHVFILKTKEKLVRLPDVCAYNLYYGWYVGELDQNDSWFDKYHKKYPKSCIGLSEFGADANIQYQTNKPVKGDYTEAYQALYHEHILKMWSERKYIWCVYAWNMFDFAADGREEGGKKGQNQKGLVTFDRKIRKDAFYIYKAYFSEEPFVHICGKRYIHRTEDQTMIKVYSNLDEVSLYVDDQLYENKKADKIFEFEMPIKSKHHIKAVSGEYSDEFDLEKVSEKDLSYESESMKIHNWFDAEVIPGHFSLKDSAFRIKRNKEGKEVLDKYYYPMINGITSKYGDVSSGVKIPKIVYKLIDLVPIEKLLKVMGSMATLEGVEGLSTELPKIKK